MLKVLQKQSVWCLQKEVKRTYRDITAVAIFWLEVPIGNKIERKGCVRSLMGLYDLLALTELLGLDWAG